MTESRARGGEAARGEPGGPEVITLRFEASGGIPNNRRLPALVYKGALGGPTPERVKELLEANGWGGTWTWRVYEFHHFHPASHEVLVCLKGWADLTIGGPDGETLRVAPGDVLVLPAGTGHCQKAAGGGFEVCGAYPPGQESPEIVRAGELDVTEAEHGIAGTPLPRTDPIYGEEGPLLKAWR